MQVTLFDLSDLRVLADLMLYWLGVGLGDLVTLLSTDLSLDGELEYTARLFNGLGWNKTGFLSLGTSKPDV